MTMATSSPTCPLPPPDFAVRRLPIIELDLSAVELSRIHLSIYPAVFFNRKSTSKTTYRFDAPNDEYGVLYCAPRFDVCFAEALIRNRFEGVKHPLVIEEREITERSISRLSTADLSVLRLVDFTQPLFPLGASLQVMSDPDYTAPNQWSLAVHMHPSAFDGIYFASRFTNEPAVAIFDRVKMRADAPVRLAIHPELPIFLDQYDIALIPDA